MRQVMRRSGKALSGTLGMSDVSGASGFLRPTALKALSPMLPRKPKTPPLSEAEALEALGMLDAEGTEAQPITDSIAAASNPLAATWQRLPIHLVFIHLVRSVMSPSQARSLRMLETHCGVHPSPG